MAFFSANFPLQSPHDTDHHHQPPSSLSSILFTCPPHDFHGMAPMLGRRSMSFSAIDGFEESNINNDGGEEDFSDNGSLVGEKKRRLNMEQVKTLERNFDLGNKLEPERKMQLSKALGLHPRQIAIWFQNRRARWKTKQLEKDYEVLKRQFDYLKADNDALQSLNQKLQAEILAFKTREPTESINLNKETDQGCSSNRSDSSSEVKLDTPRTSAAAAANSRPTSIPFFPPPPPPSSSLSIRPTHLHHHQAQHVVAQLFPKPYVRSHKFDHSVKEQSFSNVLCSVDYQSGFWPWVEQNNFN